MKMSQIQFQPGLSTPEFRARCGTEAQCQVVLQAVRWPRGFVCSKWGDSARGRFVRGALLYWQCGRCPHQTRLISGSVFASTIASI